MARLHLVRHAQPAADWRAGADPGLSEEGRAQARELADRLGPRGPLPVLTSPMRRARETAAALEARWHILAIVEPGVSEVPSPSEDPDERQRWLHQALASRWSDLGPRFMSWRAMVTGLLLHIPDDTVVVSHFILVNVALGDALGRDEVLVADVPLASVTTFDNRDRQLKLLDAPPAVATPGSIL